VTFRIAKGRAIPFPLRPKQPPFCINFPSRFFDWWIAAAILTATPLLLFFFSPFFEKDFPASSPADFFSWEERKTGWMYRHGLSFFSLIFPFPPGTTALLRFSVYLLFAPLFTFFLWKSPLRFFKDVTLAPNAPLFPGAGPRHPFPSFPPQRKRLWPFPAGFFSRKRTRSSVVLLLTKVFLFPGGFF